MVHFLIALIVFLAAHALPRKTGLRDWGIKKLGRKTYMVAYSLLSLGLLAWLVMAAINAPYIGLWATTKVMVASAIFVMLVACIFFTTGVSRPNSLSITFRGGATNTRNLGILALVRHPIIYAFLLWSAAHLLVNGDVIGVILFGGMLLFSLIGRLAVQKRAEKKLEPAAFRAEMALAAGPIGDRLKRAASLRFFIEIGAGCILFLLLLIGHQHVIGVNPLAYF